MTRIPYHKTNETRLLSKNSRRKSRNNYPVVSSPILIRENFTSKHIAIFFFNERVDSRKSLDKHSIKIE